VRFEAIVRQVDRDDPSMWDEGPNGRQVFMGRPLREFLAEMAQKDGCIDIPRPVGDAEIAFHTSDVDDSADPTIVDPRSVRVSLRKWRHRDPDTTYLQIGWRLIATDDTERAAMSGADPDAQAREAFGGS
jgi:hypothetical protein